MGSFSEVVLGFYLRHDAPEHVLAAFASVYRPDSVSNDVPRLPPPVVEQYDWWGPDQFYADRFEPEELAEREPDPWLHDWGQVLGSTMSVSIHGTSELAWTGPTGWFFSCRAGFKTEPSIVHAFLSWLGPFIGDGWGDASPDVEDQRLLVGYVKHEYDVEPALLWCAKSELTIELAVEPDEHAPARLTVVCALPGSGVASLLSELSEAGSRVYPGFQSDSLSDDRHPMSSRYAGAVLRDLESGAWVTVYDALYCDSDVRRWLVEEYRRRMPTLQLEVIGFANDPETCRHNVLHLAEQRGENPDPILSQIDTLAPGYRPQGEVRDVTRFG